MVDCIVSSSARTKSSKNEAVDPQVACCICYRLYSTNKRADAAEGPLKLACGHVFGATCVSQWLASAGTCPLCRARLVDVKASSYHEYNVPARAAAPWFTALYPWEQPSVPSPAWHRCSRELIGVTVESEATHDNTFTFQGQFRSLARVHSYRNMQQSVADSSNHSSPQSRRRSGFRRPARLNAVATDRQDDIWTLAVDQPAVQGDLWVADALERDGMDHDITESDACFNDLLVDHETWMMHSTSETDEYSFENS